MLLLFERYNIYYVVYLSLAFLIHMHEYIFRTKTHVDDTTVTTPVTDERSRPKETKEIWEDHTNPVFPGNCYIDEENVNYEVVPDAEPNYEVAQDFDLNYEVVPDLGPNHKFTPDLDPDYEVAPDFDPPYENVPTLYPPRYAPIDINHDIDYEKLREVLEK